MRQATNGTVFTSRTASETYSRCPAERFWGYEFARGQLLEDPATLIEQGAERMVVVKAHPGGLSPVRKSIYLVTGGAVHEGLAVLLRAAQYKRAITPTVVEVAVRECTAFFWKEAGEMGHGLDPQDNTPVPKLTTDPALAAELGLEDEDDFARRKVEWIAKEQASIAEGLVRAFAVRELERLLERYEVLEVEREGAFTLYDNNLPTSDTTTHERIIFQFRPDALLRDRSDGNLYVMSFKTTSQWGWLTAEKAKVDVQGISEAVGLEQEGKLNEGDEGGNFVHAVQMLHLLKGKRQEDDRKGWKVTYCRWTRGWKSVEEGITGRTTKYAWKWNWTDEGGRNRALSGQKWQPFYAWEEFGGGVKEWVEMLASGVVQPEAGDPFAADSSAFVSPEPYFRQPRDFEEWLWSTRASEAKVIADADVVNGLIAEEGLGSNRARQAIAERFPKTRASCIRYGGKCSFYDLCHSGENISANPLGSGLFVLRTPHHEIIGGEEW